jgi:hypothetical protein
LKRTRFSSNDHVSYLVLSSYIPDGKANIFVFNSFHIEPWHIKS